MAWCCTDVRGRYLLMAKFCTVLFSPFRALTRSSKFGVYMTCNYVWCYSISDKGRPVSDETQSYATKFSLICQSFEILRFLPSSKYNGGQWETSLLTVVLSRYSPHANFGHCTPQIILFPLCGHYHGHHCSPLGSTFVNKKFGSSNIQNFKICARGRLFQCNATYFTAEPH